MATISELIRTEDNGTISFGDYTLAAKAKLDNYEVGGDIYKVKTFKEITKLERNGLFVYESVPGTAVTGFKQTADAVEFTVEGPEDAQITLELARMIREDFLQQNAFEPGDSFTQQEKMYALMNLIFSFDKKARRAIEQGADVQAISQMAVRERIGRAKSVAFEDYKAEFEAIDNAIDEELATLGTVEGGNKQ